MNVASLFLRAIADGNGAVCSPYGFTGDWNDKEKEIIEAEIKKHVPEQVHASFNNWHIGKQVGESWVNFYAVRATWDSGQLNASSAEGLAEKLKRYYESYEVVQDA